jgi:adenosylcobinamide kinase / adenosylcobinamide-phosphate guanylyltransferase
MAHVLVTGGVRSGKSRYAEQLLADVEQVTYLAAGYPTGDDPEWNARVAAHQLHRPASWRTVETLELAQGVREADGPVLIDCLGTWLTRTLDAWDGWEQPVAGWEPRLNQEVVELASVITTHPHDVVVVTNEVGWGLVSEYPAGRVFADQLGRLNQVIAAACDEVVLLIAGRPVHL